MLPSSAWQQSKLTAALDTGFQLKPHRRETFTLSNDEFFVEKVRDIVGLI